MQKRGLILLFSAIILTGSGCTKKTQPSAMVRKSSPQVTDVLKNKTVPQILELKYGGEKGAVKALCTLDSHKTQVPAPTPSSVETNPPIKPPGFIPPIQYPAENSVVFDLHSQQEVDKDLKKSVEILLSYEKDNQVLNLKLDVAPLSFEPQLALDIGNTKYIMKYTPTLTYAYSLEVVSGETSSQIEGEGKIYEKVLFHQTVGETQVDQNRYQYELSCILNTALNEANEELTREFEEHWRCINCAGPQ